MSIPALPAEGSQDWYPWASGLDQGVRNLQASGVSAVGRTGRLTVASSEAPADVRAGCDYECTGTNDQTVINQALLRASRPNDGFGGQGFIGVELVGPTFYVGHNNSTSITMYPSTMLWGNGNGTLISPQYSTAGIDRGVIELANVNVTRAQVSWLTIARHNAVDFNGHGIKFVGSGNGDTYEVKTGNDPYNMIHHVNVHRATRKGIWCTGTTGGSREMQISHCVLFNCTEQGILIDSSSDSQVSDCRATGGGAFPGFELGGGNTRVANCKAYYRGNKTGATTGADGFLISSSRCEIDACGAQDCAGYGFQFTGAEAKASSLYADSNATGYRIASSGYYAGLFATWRAGGNGTQDTSILLSGSPQVYLTGHTNTGGTHVSGSAGANSYVRVVRSGTTLQTAG